MTYKLKNKYFEDTDFNTNSFKNIDNLSEYQRSNIEWMRPIELAKNPKLGIYRSGYLDVKQGFLDNCSFVSACACISSRFDILNQIFKHDINLYGDNYIGYLEINIWLRNEWTAIVIDDRLPTIKNKLCFSRNDDENNFWVAILEKAFAKIYNGYENLIGIDPAFILICLTGGLSMRFNPTNLNERASILEYLNLSKKMSSLIGILGFEINRNLELNDNKIRIGHSCALIDIIHNDENNELYLKIYNSQSSINLSFKSHSQQKISILQNIEKEDILNGVLTLSLEDLFEYFEVLTIVLINQNQRVLYLNDLNWNESCNLFSLNYNYNLTEKYLKSPHIVFEISKRNNKNKNELLKIAFNLIIDDFKTSDYFSLFVLPIRSNENYKLFFVNYSFGKGTLSNSNPYCEHFDVLEGIYLLVPIISSKKLPKKFNICITSLDNDVKLTEHENEMLANEENNSYYLNLTKLNKKVKLIMSKCCVCDCLLENDSYIQVDSKVFCQMCYALSFKCQRCDKEMNDAEYYNINSRIYCKVCILKVN